MSLNRIASVETFTDQHSRRGSDASVRHRKLSFNPFPQEWQGSPSHKTGPLSSRPGSPAPPFRQGLEDDSRTRLPSKTVSLSEPVGAFEVPAWKRILQIVAAVIYCLFAAGIVFGYAAIKPVFIQEGAYQGSCPDGDTTCIEIHLNLMFTVAAVGTNVVALPLGAVLDHYGPRVCGIVGSIFLFCGSLILANTSSLPFDGYLPGYLFLALGGPCTFISSFQLSNAFPKHSGLILALLTGAFDASSALFLVYRLIFDATGGSFDHRKFFTVYLIVPVIIFILQIVLMPRQSYKTVGELLDQVDETQAVVAAVDGLNGTFASRNGRISGPRQYDDQVDEHTALLDVDDPEEIQQRGETVIAEIESLIGSVRGDHLVEVEERKNANSGVWGIMHDKNVLQQISSPWFILICIFTIVQMTRINFFVATIRAQYTSIFHDYDTAAEINNFFDIALPLGGLISIPFIGIILDHTSTVVILAVLVSFATIIGVLGVLPYQWAAYAGICLFVLYRPFYYTAVSDYSAKVFGFRTFGTVYGLIICLAGLFNLSQSGLDVLFHRVFNENPTPVNIILLALGFIIGAALTGYVTWKSRSLSSHTR